MLTFKTQFPVAISSGMDDFVECCRIWITKSPHTNLSSIIPAHVREGRFGDEEEVAHFGCHRSDTVSLGGVRYEKNDNDRIRWVTEVIGHKTRDEFWVSVQLNVDSDLPVDRLEQGKRPYIVKLLMESFAGGYDGELLVTDRPVFLRDGDFSLAEKIICADAGSVMPVVYVSRSESGDLIVNPHQLSKWVSGMAHVVVEPSRKFSSEIMRRVYGENVYGGAVGIYWPDGIGKWTYLPGKWSSPSFLQAAIARKVRMSLLYQRIRRECTWSYLQEVISRQKLEELKASGSENIDEYIQHFDREISAKDEEIQRLEAELVRARYGRREISSEVQGESKVINLEIGESDLYQGEQLGLIIEALKVAAESSEHNSRRSDILRSIIGNNENPGDREEILTRLKDVLRQYTSMNAAVRSDLEGLGFSINEEGKHYKILMRGDSRYPFILPKTGSDWRGGLNAFSDLRKKLF